MSEIKIKEGKVSINDRDKYRAMAVDVGDILSVPRVLSSAFDEADLVFKWVSKAKIARHGGYHPSNWIPYEISEIQKKDLPKAGNVVTNHLERGDLVLAVKPRELQEKHKKDVARKTANQLDSFHNETDATGKKIHRSED